MAPQNKDKPEVETLIEDMVPVKTMPDNALHTDASR